MWEAKLRNNTDYPNGIEFDDVAEIREFIDRYYGGERGDQYWESWTLWGDYPDEIFDVLSPSEYEDNEWTVKTVAELNEIDRESKIERREDELDGQERGYATGIEIAPAGGDGNIEWNASVIEIIKLDENTVAYRYSDDFFDGDWLLGDLADAVDHAVDALEMAREEAW